MTSRSVENTHAAELKKLILESGLECTRIVAEEAVIAHEGFEEEEVIEEAALEAQSILEEEQKSVAEEELPEEKPVIFPTPSLRRVLPDSVRTTLQDNAIHGLPETFNTKIDTETIPYIKTTPKKVYIDALAEIVGCKEYTRSLAEYWFLDTLANLLRRAQADGMDKPTQALLILWFCEWIKEMQHFDAASRERMMRRFQENMLSAATFIGETGRIPSPADVFVTYKAKEDNTEIDSKTSKTSNLKTNVSFIGNTNECSLLDLSKILHYIYDLFSTDYQYNLIRSVFTFPPDYIHVNYPYKIQTPKRLYQPLKPKNQKQLKKEKNSPSKLEKSSQKLDKELDDYEILMELKAQQQKEVEEQEERDKEAWNVRNSILPLYMAVTETLYDKYWPPPPPEPEEIDIEKKESKKKGKKNRKK